MAPRRGLLLDWGGVMTSDVFASFTAFSEAEGLHPDAVRDAFRHDPAARGALADLECGRLAEPEFERRLGAVLGVEQHAGLVARLFQGMRADEAMQEATAAFRAAGVRTGLLSNSWGAATYDDTRLADLFDVLVISGELGMRKPDPAIYAVATERMGLAPGELVFVDDLPGNLKPARALGMATVVHRDAAATIAELEELLGVPAAAAPRD